MNLRDCGVYAAFVQASWGGGIICGITYMTPNPHLYNV